MSRAGLTYTENNDEKEVDVGNVVELKPQVLWYETQGCVFSGPYLVPRVTLFDVSLFVFCFIGKGDVHVDRSRFRPDRRAGTLRRYLLSVRANFGVMCLLCRRCGFMSIENREAFPRAALARSSLGGPPHPLDRFRYIISALELYFRHVDFLTTIRSLDRGLCNQRLEVNRSRLVVGVRWRLRRREK